MITLTATWLLYSLGTDSAKKQTKKKKNQILRLQMFTVEGKEQGV
jgi:hypothetical protein